MDDATMLRRAMDRTAQELPPLPDLVPVAVRQGRRRRARARLTVAGGVFGTVTAAALGLTLLPGADPGTALPASPPAAFPSAYRTPVRVEPTPGQTPPEKVSAEEGARRAQFQQQVSALLDELLPASVSDVRPVADEVSSYRITAGGTVFPVKLSVRPAENERLPDCRNIPSKRTTCEEAGLDGGRTAQVYGMAVNDPGTLGSRVVTRYGRSSVLLSVDPSAGASAPVTPDQLLAVVRDPRFTDLLKYADAYPVQKKGAPVRGG
ncbi:MULTISPECIES: hypothetical protein [unclassified Streptomyces]|uniref:hypothetical protein n=1 Tax=unclassified Streptomyces TaxID=2593676 RepID=UPI0012FF5AC8|nr:MULTISPECIES: hypothetical protein [unclassified Streptomyces]